MRHFLGWLCLIAGFIILTMGLLGSDDYSNDGGEDLISPCGMPYCNP